LTDVGGTLFFNASDANGRELWKSDGTAPGTVVVKDILAGPESSEPETLTNLNGVLLFPANDGVSGRQPLRGDGTAAGTSLVKDIAHGIENGLETYFRMVVSGGLLYFAGASDLATGLELWKSDGTEAGTVLVKDIRTTGPYPSSWPMALTDV